MNSNSGGLLSIIYNNIGNVSSEEDLEDWNTSKASTYLLKIVVKLTPSEMIDKLMIHINGKLMV